MGPGNLTRNALVACLVAPRFGLFVQLGDGEITVLDDEGKLIRPMRSQSDYRKGYVDSLMADDGPGGWSCGSCRGNDGSPS